MRQDRRNVPATIKRFGSVTMGREIHRSLRGDRSRCSESCDRCACTFKYIAWRYTIDRCRGRRTRVSSNFRAIYCPVLRANDPLCRIGVEPEPCSRLLDRLNAICEGQLAVKFIMKRSKKRLLKGAGQSSTVRWSR